MALTILDAATAAAVAAATTQDAQAAALIAPWASGNVTARVMAGGTLLATLTQGPWVQNNGVTPRQLTIGSRMARTFVAIGAPTKVVFRAGSVDIFEITAGVGSGSISFVANVSSPALERIDGLVITANSGLPTSGGSGGGPAPTLVGTYRSENTNLLADVAAGTVLAGTAGGNIVTPARAGVAAPKDDFIWGVMGPNADYWEISAKAAWTNQGGDWRDKTGASQGTGSPYFTFTANAVGSGSSLYTGIDVQQAVIDAFRRGQWCEFIVRSTAQRSIVSQNHPTLAAPRIVGTYADGTAFTLLCTACVQLTTTASSAYTQIGAPKAAVGATNVALGFEVPTQEALTATLQVVVDDHTGTAATITGNLIDPPVNHEPVLKGVAAPYERDAGINAVSTVVLNQNYADGSILSNWVIPAASTAGLDVFAKSAWDLSVQGGASDPTKLPTAFNGVPIAGTNKWFHKQDKTANISLVSSGYTGDGFEPLAPGLGALRIVVPGDPGADGAATDGNALLGVDLMTLLPLSMIGNAGSGSVRFYLRPGFDLATLEEMLMLRSGPGATAEYALAQGKFGIGFHHLTAGPSWSGGNNNDGGDNLGWSARLGYIETPANVPQGGFRSFVHSQDMRPARANLPFGKNGGLGAALFPNTWTCIEIALTLNTYNAGGAVGTSPADGTLTVTINGRLDSVYTGLKWRDGAIDYLVTPNGPGLPPFRQIGLKGLWMNFYQGGIRSCSRPQVWFVGSTVAAVG